MTRDLAGKVILVTGATEGIGKAAALDFAKRGATVAITGRNKEKSERVVRELIEGSGSSAVELYLGDLSVLSGMRSVVSAFRARHDRLDVLVNNAGGVFSSYELTEDGIEKTFALNHVAYFVVTTGLLDLLEKSPDARVVSTSSAAHQMGKLDATNMDAVVKRDGKAGFGAYGDSKLANILFTTELARRLAGKGVTANCIHPGWVHTGFALNNTGTTLAFLTGLAAPLFARSPEKGAETVIWLATSPEAASFNGEYFHDKKPYRRSSRSRDEAAAKALWDLSERLTAAPARAAGQRAA